MKVFRSLFGFWRVARRAGGARGVFDIARHAPQYARLIARLFADARVSAFPKAVLVGVGLFAISPLNIPDWIPVIGPLDDIGLAVFAISFFLRHIPAAVMSEHRRAVGLDAIEEV